jgi:hypothetical protein
MPSAWFRAGTWAGNATPVIAIGLAAVALGMALRPAGNGGASDSAATWPPANTRYVPVTVPEAVPAEVTTTQEGEWTIVRHWVRVSLPGVEVLTVERIDSVSGDWYHFTRWRTEGDDLVLLYSENRSTGREHRGGTPGRVACASSSESRRSRH